MDSDVIPMEGCNVEFVSPAKRGVESHVTFAPGNQECLNILHQAKNGDNLRKLRKAFEKSTKKFNERFQTDSLTTKESAIILQSLAENGNMSFEFGIFSRKGACKKSQKKGERNAKSLSKRWK
ncbi:uncharacterized protein [Ptychodera flava]|uniref:uncharacterized protein n=1 Tax=Ptychodera flava TaxID=63121 RepID=UPI00396A9961